MSNKKIALLSFTENGKLLCEKINLTECYDFTCVNSPFAVKEFVAQNFNAFDGFIFVGAIGIAVRLIKDYIKSKDTDPAVIVLDEKGEYIIPILSGHLGGANEIAINLSEKISAIPIITTATDINGKFAVDNWAKKYNLKISNINCIKNISSRVLKNEGINFHNDYASCDKLPFIYDKNANVGICISKDENKKPFDITLNIIPKTITLGVGCKKNTDSDLFEEYILSVLKNNNVSLHSIAKIASIDIKSNEKAILDFSEKYNIPCSFYSAEQLNELSGEFTKSDFVKSITGVDNVCERSALKSGDNSHIILAKQSYNGITVALAEKEWSCIF